MQVFEQGHIFLVFLFFGLIFLDDASLDLLNLFVIISEFGLQCFHFVGNKAETIFKLFLHQSYMSFHHISHKLSVNESLIGLGSWLSLHLRHECCTSLLGSEGSYRNLRILILLAEINNNLCFVSFCVNIINDQVLVKLPCLSRIECVRAHSCF